MTTLDGNLTSKLVYLQKAGVEPEPEKEMKFTQLTSIKDDMIYSIIFGGDVNAYNHYAPTFQKIVDSINITTPMY